MTTRRERDAALQALYDELPRIDCQGKCWTSCGVIDMSPRERQRIKERGIRISTPREVFLKPERHFCEALTEDRRCAVYELRPAICRLWGVADGMECPYGCKAERLLSYTEGMVFLEHAQRVGGGDYQADITDIRDSIRRAMRDPKMAPVMRQILESGVDGDGREAAINDQGSDPFGLQTKRAVDYVKTRQERTSHSD